MNATGNQLPKITDFEKAIFLAQYAYENGFRGSSAQDLYNWIIGKIDISQLVITAGLPDPFPEPNDNLSVSQEGQWTILARPGTYYQPGYGQIQVNEGEIVLAQSTNGDYYDVVKKIDLPKGQDGVDGQDGDMLAPEWTGTSADAGLTYPVVRAYQGKLYRVKDGETTTVADVPSVSDKWELIGGVDKNLTKRVDDLDNDLNINIHTTSADFEQGNISTTTGVLLESTYHIRTANFIESLEVGKKVTFEVKNKYWAYIYEFDDNGVFKKVSTRYSNGYWDFTPEYPKLKLVLRNEVNVTAITPAEAWDVNLKQVFDSTKTQVSKNTADISRISKVVDGYEIYYRLDSKNVEFGTLDNGSPVSHGKFVRSKNFITGFNRDFTALVKVPAGKRVVISWYDNNDIFITTTLLNNTASATDAQYTIPVLGEKIKMVTDNDNSGGGIDNEIDTVEYSVEMIKPKLEDRLKDIYSFYSDFINPLNESVSVTVDRANYFIYNPYRIRQRIPYSAKGVDRITLPAHPDVTIALVAYKGNTAVFDSGFKSVEMTYDLKGFDYFAFVFGGEFTDTSKIEGYTFTITRTSAEVLKDLVKPRHKGVSLNFGAISIAHRGTPVGLNPISQNFTAPQNSIDALLNSARAGFEWCECDLRKTADGKFVIFHDANIDSLLRLKSDYDTPITEGIPLNSLTLADLRENYVQVSPYPHQRKPVPTLLEWMQASKLLNVNPIIELKDSFTDGDLDEIWDICSSILTPNKIGFTSLGDGYYLDYLRAKSEDVHLYYGGGNYLDPDHEVWDVTPKKNTYISVGGNWMNANGNSRIPKFNKMGLGVYAWGVGLSKFLEWEKLGLSGYIIDSLPPSLEGKNEVFSVDSWTNDNQSYFTINNHEIKLGHREPIYLLNNDVLRLAPNLDNEIIEFGGWEVFIQFTGSLDIRGTSITSGTVVSTTLTNEMYYSRAFIGNNLLALSVTAKADTVIHRICVRVVKY